MRKSSLLIFILVFSLFLISCSSQIKSVKINGINIPVELAITDEQKQIGLMNRTNLTGGMLFVYDEDAPRNFWMKNTLIPLDMIFIDENKTITKIHHAVPCETDVCKVYSAKKAKYVLEVKGDFTEEKNIQRGDKVSLIK